MADSVATPRSGPPPPDGRSLSGPHLPRMREACPGLPGSPTRCPVPPRSGAEKPSANDCAKRGQAITFGCAKRGTFVASMEPTAPSSAPFLSEGRPGSSGRIRTLHGGEDGMQINRFASQSQPQNATRSAERRRSLGSESDRHSAASREVTASHRASQFLGKVSTLVPQRRSAAMGPAGPPRGLAVRFSSRAPVGLAQGQTLPEGDAPRGAPNCDNPSTAVGVDGVTCMRLKTRSSSSRYGKPRHLGPSLTAPRERSPFQRQ